MEEKKRNIDAIKIKETAKKDDVEKKKKKRTETARISKGKWEHIQEAVGGEFETQTETVHQCEDCKEKGDGESGKETEKDRQMWRIYCNTTCEMGRSRRELETKYKNKQ